ncbi:MAG TPA: methyltransferase domain-containing protein [Pyrinomonadaceae bacterium]|jgi:ubiquinone/menaquinone biosynthesis C-methylase UbiE|nr:methyltransferase domain-containing protein [Pyrinomonadaceae bacterium]
MSSPVNLYDNFYDNFSASVLEQVRAETYGEDVGQSSWMTADELERFIELLQLQPTSTLLEIGSGSGGPALYVARKTKCRVTGLDVNEFGVRNANELAAKQNLDARAHFQLADASEPLPFNDATFDAIVSNDVMCHVPQRSEVLKEWHRVLQPGGRMLFTDAMVITGIVSHEEIATRSSIGRYFYLPRGENERLIEEAGFELILSDDVTANAALVAKRWHDARANHGEDLIRIEGKENFEGLQKFLSCVHTISSEGRVSRYLYLGRKPAPEA